MADMITLEVMRYRPEQEIEPTLQRLIHHNSK